MSFDEPDWVDGDDWADRDKDDEKDHALARIQELKGDLDAAVALLVIALRDGFNADDEGTARALLHRLNS